MLKLIGLSIRLGWRDIKCNQWTIVFFALILAIGAVTSIHFYVDRVARGIEEQGARFIGGNLAIRSATPIPKAWHVEAQHLGLRSAEVWTYLSMITSHNQFQLANVQAISVNYPLLTKPHHPEPNTVWVEPRLLQILKLNVNDTINVGSATFKISKTIVNDNSVLAANWLIAPTLIIQLADVPATQTVLPGSRVDYRLLLAGNKDKLEAFKSWVQPQLQPGQQVYDVRNQQSALRNTLNEIDNYLQLILLVCVAMSGVAIALSVQDYLRQHYEYVALWRCLGAKAKQIRYLFLWQLLFIAFIAGAVGITIGYGLQSVFTPLLQSYLHFELPEAGMMPIWLGFTISGLLLFIFAYPLITQLPETPPLTLWRDADANQIQYKFHWLPLIISSGLLIMLISRFNFSLLTLFFTSTLVLSVSVLYGLSHLLLSSVNYLHNYTRGAIRRGLSQMVHHANTVSTQFAGFALILICLFVIASVKDNFLLSWQQTLSPTTPNYFAFNIAPDDINSVQNYLKKNHVAAAGIYPMARGRLVGLNQKPIMTQILPTARGHNALHRELNLSWMWEYPSDNSIVQGKHWQKSMEGTALVSVESSLAETLQLKIGDELTLQIGDKQITARVYNFRRLDWTSFHPNFYLIFIPGILETFPHTYITSFYLSNEKRILANQLVQRFPNVTVIDIANVLSQIQTLVSKISIAIQYLFLFALAAGILIFVASLQASKHERIATHRLLRTLGASRNYLFRSTVVEYFFFFLLVLLTAYTIAKIISYFLLHYLL